VNRVALWRNEVSGSGPPLVLRARRWSLRVLVAISAAAIIMLAHADFQRMQALALERYGPEGLERVERWQRLVEVSRQLPEREQLERVNEFFNVLVEFVPDQLAWGVEDYWATPLETLGRAVGDCEDYSIAKYATLGLLGVPLERLRLTYVRAELALPGAAGPQAHMVLAYYPEPGAEPLVLDNLVADILPASQRPDLQPVFSFNSEGLWLGGVRASAAPTARLSRWRDTLRRMGEEGLR